MIEKSNGFYLDNNDVLFFNIFIKNNKLYIITPINKNYDINKTKIKITYNSNELTCLEEITKNCYEATQILIYDFNFNSEDIYEINVSYNEKIKVFMLKHIKTCKNKKLAVTTLFKDDYKLNQIFYDYYKKQGVEHFYMYYNGIINDEIQKYYDKEDITLIEWNYIYWNNNSKYSQHYAQLGQMHDAIYNFGKDNYEYMLFCDLDEYLHFRSGNIIDLLSDTTVDTFCFYNLWANTTNFDIPETFPTEFYVADHILGYNYRSKCIHKMDNVKYINIHSASTANNICFNNNFIFYHFASWSSIKRRIETKNLIKLRE